MRRAGCGRRLPCTRFIPGAMTSAGIGRTAKAAAVRGTISRRHQLAHLAPTRSACTTCTAMFGNGFRTATKTATPMLHLTAEQRLRSLHVFALFAVVPGTTNRRTSAALTVMRFDLSIGTAAVRSELPERCNCRRPYAADSQGTPRATDRRKPRRQL